MTNFKHILILLMIVLVGCQPNEHQNNNDHSEHTNEAPTVSITQWSPTMELLMKYETPIVRQDVDFTIHLTSLADFQPVQNGSVTLLFKSENGNTLSVQSDELFQSGIFTPEIVFDTIDEYRFFVKYDGLNVSEIFDIGELKIYRNAHDIPEIHGEEHSDEINYSKEQQWKSNFATDIAWIRPVKSSIRAVGEICTHPENYAEIAAPVEGIVTVSKQYPLAISGQSVKKAQILAVLKPPLALHDTWAEVYLSFEQAKTEYERAKRLKERNAISDRDYEAARRDYEMHQAGTASYFSDDGESDILHYDSENQQFSILAPFSGVIQIVDVHSGQIVESHQKMFSIMNPSKIRLKIEVFENQMGKLKELSGLSIRIPGNEQPINFGKGEFTLLSRANILDPVTRTLTIWLEADNHDEKLYVGQTFNASLYSGNSKPVLTVPRSAVLDEDLHQLVFVQEDGECFEKRYVKTGEIWNNYIAIEDGLEEGERVVSRGAYQIKLAASKEAVGAAHNH